MRIALLKRWDEAREVLERAVAVAPQDPEANYSLGMVFAQAGENGKAYDYLQRALKVRPIYPEALNNLGVLYLVTHRRDEAVGSFEQCIRVAPAFDQAYLNLARVYALEGARDKARSSAARPAQAASRSRSGETNDRAIATVKRLGPLKASAWARSADRRTFCKTFRCPDQLALLQLVRRARVCLSHSSSEYFHIRRRDSGPRRDNGSPSR